MADRNNDPGNWMPWIALISGLRGIMGGPESTIATHEQIEKRPRVSILTFINLLIGALIGFVALIVHFSGWLDITDISLQDKAVWLVFLGYMLLLLVPAGMLANRFGWSLFNTYLWALATTWLLSFFGMVLIAESYEMTRVLWSGIALVFALASLPFIYHNWMELRSPYWRRSPYEEAIQHHIMPGMARMMAGNQDMVPRLRIPYRLNSVPREAMLPQDEAGGAMVGLHRDDVAILEFIREAAHRGLARSNWLLKGQENLRLPRSGVEISRTKYDEIMAVLDNWGVVNLGGDGVAASWNMEPPEALAFIERHIVEQLMEGKLEPKEE